ncbi:Hypp3150 [Branchiostoma lanceolatum]|uniref:Hypp3150 protein n=1 Tax=Branchiostoma lanceolatum TaxID=7740 RepID=A0A8K0EQV3_BRALA|nr:Hypp3150 [Branchiostoma lanceolatum]
MRPHRKRALRRFRLSSLFSRQTARNETSTEPDLKTRQKKKSRMRLWIAGLILALSWFVAKGSTYESSTDSLRHLLANQFLSDRHHVTNPEGKEDAAIFIMEQFKKYDLQVFSQVFDTDTKGVKGRNIIGTWAGLNTGTTGDRPVLIAAHYDTARSSPGVCADGSGMAALLEAVRIITARSCMQENSVIFAAFDFEVQEHATLDQAACHNAGCGSAKYMKELLIPYIKSLGISSNDFQGAFVLDSVLNFNSTEDSQRIPDEERFKEAPGFQEAYTRIKADGNKGDFIALVGRNFDSPLYQTFISAWESLPDTRFKNQLLHMPDKDLPALTDPYWDVYTKMTKGDHYSFWVADSDFKAIHITDSAQERGYMQECHHKPCDNTDHLTQDNMAFLKKVTDATIDATMTLAVFPETCTDPWTKSPEMLKSGIFLTGKVWHTKKTRHSFKIHLKEFKPNGAVVATIMNGSITLDLDGRYNADNKMLILRMAQPSNTAPLPVKYDPVYLMKWTMTGEVVGFAGGILYYGFLTGPTNEAEEFSVTYSEDPSVGPNQANVVLGVLLMIAVIAIIVVIVYLVYLKRTRKPFTELTEKSAINT